MLFRSESTFQIFSKKLREMFSFGRAELILLEKKGAKMGIKRILEIVGTGNPARAGAEIGRASCRERV